MAEDTLSVGAVSPLEAYTLLKDDPKTALVDVRTMAEWSFVGLPDLSPIGKDVVPVEWVSFPDMAPNPAFLAQLKDRLGPRADDIRHLLFICRSGARSFAAASLALGAFDGDGREVACTNVAEGFEGDLCPERHRGATNGWKAAGLPWRQT